jgi:redox-sensitive bicupin YhaK (pirin superfamily)
MRRGVTEVFGAETTLGGAGRRFVGSTDLRGQGVQYPITHLGPFILVEEALGIMGPGMPPFGSHPHAGLAVLSYVAEGGRWRSLCNQPGFEHVEFGPGEGLLTNAGRGAAHDEHSVGEGEHAMLQLILRLPASRRGMAPTIRKLVPAEVAPGVLRLLDREALAGTGLDVTVTRVTISAEAVVEVAVDPAHTLGFVYVRSGELLLDGQTVAAEHVAVLAAEGEALVLEGTCDVYVGTAAPLEEAWVKLLGHDGFVVAADEHAAQALLREYAADRAGFGRRD